MEDKIMYMHIETNSIKRNIEIQLKKANLNETTIDLIMSEFENSNYKLESLFKSINNLFENTKYSIGEKVTVDVNCVDKYKIDIPKSIEQGFIKSTKKGDDIIQGTIVKVIPPATLPYSITINIINLSGKKETIINKISESNIINTREPLPKSFINNVKN